MSEIPYIEHVSFDEANVHINNMVLFLKGQRYILQKIIFRRERSIVEEALEISLYGYELRSITTHLQLPFSADRIRIRNKNKYEGSPFVHRYRSDTKGYRMGALILPFHDFDFYEASSTKVHGHERHTHHFYQSKLIPSLRLPLRVDVEEDPPLVAQAQDALLAFIQQGRVYRRAQTAFRDAEDRYIKLDPGRVFQKRHEEITNKLKGA